QNYFAAFEAQAMDAVAAHNLLAVRALVGDVLVPMARTIRAQIRQHRRPRGKFATHELGNRHARLDVLHEQFNVAQAQGLARGQWSFADWRTIDKRAVGGLK